ncbi:hypothetical protein DMH04_53450 [Kibdelosporangium aridum]|uniref:Uncharacterized protein n=1 Tax=Kibdelosporangium aridum TaxID=2030 RepID=A0A428Y2V0_KIBAR|nr:hypothetical protein DMH04_53450 [Kibdelosporangium aridum]
MDLNWYDLHKVYEVVRENVGGPAVGPATERLKAQNWVSASDIDGFRHSANTKRISGDAARHARGPQPRTPDTMTLPEGREMISRLVRCWIDSLS